MQIHYFRTILFLTFIIFCSAYAQCDNKEISPSKIPNKQTDTLFFDIDWKLTTSENATFYRLKPKKEKKGYRIIDYYRSGQVQVSAWSKSLDKDNFDGDVKWYFENGQLKEQCIFQNGIRDGLAQRYDSTGHLIAEGVYKDNRPYSGFFCDQYENQTLLYEFKDGEIIKKTISDDSKNNQVLAIFTQVHNGNNKHFEVSYYNSTGNFVGRGIYNGKGEQEKGVFATYYSDPMTVTRLEFLSEGKVDSTYEFYTDETLKKIDKTINGEQINITYYPNGQIIDTLYLEDGYPNSGCYAEFERNMWGKPVNHPLALTNYRNGLPHGKYSVFHKNGVLREKGTYQNGYQTGDVLFYDQSGEILCKGTYRNHKKWDGRFVIDKTIRDIKSYEQGDLKETFLYYPNGQLKQYEIKDSICITYDSIGNEIAKLLYYKKRPYEGTYMNFVTSGSLYATEEYKDGKRTSVIYNSTTGNLSSKVTDSDGYQITTDYFFSGEIKKIEDERKNEITYYSKEGQIIGVLKDSCRIKNGYECKYKGDWLTTINEYKNDKKVYEKILMPNGQTLLETDFYGKCLLFNRWGDLISEGTFKDGEPYDGTICKIDNHQSKEVITMKNGVKEGPFMVYNWSSHLNDFIISKEGFYSNNQLHGLYKEYFNDKLLQSITYANGMKDGPASFYDANGVLLSKATYKNDRPYEGTFYEHNGYLSLIDCHYSYHEGTLNGDYVFFDQDGNINKTVNWNMGSQTTQSIWVNDKEYIVKFKNNIRWEGIEPDGRKLKYYQNGKYIKDQTFSNKNFDLLESETNYNRINGHEKITEYYDNGIPSSIANYDGLEKDGELTRYDRNGKLISKGIYKNDSPYSGQFIFPHKRNNTDYILLEITNQKAKAMVVRDEIKTSYIELKQESTLSINEWQEKLISLLDMLNSSNEFNLD